MTATDLACLGYAAIEWPGEWPQRLAWNLALAGVLAQSRRGFVPLDPRKRTFLEDCGVLRP